MAKETTDLFKSFLANLKLDNSDKLSKRYGEITAALNKKFRNTESKTSHSLQVGSFGRATAIRGASDLDLLYIMPKSLWEDYRPNGHYKLLADAKKAINDRYPKTNIRVDRLVVTVKYKDFHVEVQPVFEQSDGSFLYPDTKGDGNWKTTKPRPELAAMKDFTDNKNNNLRRLCKMLRSWRNHIGLKMGGLLIDTLAYNFLNQTSDYDAADVAKYPHLIRDMFAYLADEPAKEYYLALGSNQRVSVQKKFQKKARRAYNDSIDAINASGKAGEYKKWKRVFGRTFPSPETVEKAFLVEAGFHAPDTEQFIEDMFRVDIQNHIRIDCSVEQKGFRKHMLRTLLLRKIPLLRNKSLEFSVVQHDINEDFTLYWKVLNRGPEALRKKCVRGEITADAGRHRKSESTAFKGDHMVECYAVVSGIVVARNALTVPIDASEADYE